MTEQRKDGGAEDIAAERQAQADAFHEANSNCFTEFESFDSGWKAGVAYVRAASSAAPDGGKGKAGCSMGVGCDEAGVCYAMAHGQPERCAAPQAEHMDGGKGEAVIGRPDWLRIFGTHFEVNSTWDDGTPRGVYCDGYSFDEFRREIESLYTAPQVEFAPRADAEKDTARLEWLIRMVSGHEFRRIGVEIGSGGLEYGREAIDAAIEQAVKRDRK